MATLLLIVIYAAFIGLGIPDSLFGAAWPAVYAEFDLPISAANFVTMIIPCGTIISSMLSSRLIVRFGTNKLTAFSTLLTALALLGFSFSGNLLFFCLFAIPLGLGAALIVLLLPGSPYASAAGLFLVGLGNGPLFPNFNYLTPENFGAKVSQSVMGTQMAVSYVGIMLVPALFGALGQWAGVRIFPAYLLVFYVIMLVMTGKVKKHGKPGNNSPYFSLFPK